MRVLICGGGARERALLAEALAGNGFVIVEAGSPFDVRLIVDKGPGERLVRGDLALDPARREATRGDRSAALTGIECALLAALMRADAPLAKHVLLDVVWGYGFDPGTNMVAVHISRLRAKIGSDAILFTRDGYCIA